VTKKETFGWGLTSPGTESNAFYLKAFTPEECDRIIEIGESSVYSSPVEEATLSTEGTIDFSIRKSKISWVRSDVEHNNWLFQKITAYILDANKKFFEFDLIELESLQFTKYVGTEKGFYSKHIDMMPKGHSCRKLSFSIQLSDPDTYKGGSLVIYTSKTPNEVQRDLGCVHFFPSYVLHEVIPVTKGTRYSLVGWVLGPRFK